MDDVESVLRDIREQVREESGVRPGSAARDQAAPSRITIARKVWRALPHLPSYRRHWKSQFKLLVKRQVKRTFLYRAVAARIEREGIRLRAFQDEDLQRIEQHFDVRVRQLESAQREQLDQLLGEQRACLKQLGLELNERAAAANRAVYNMHERLDDLASQVRVLEASMPVHVDPGPVAGVEHERA